MEFEALESNSQRYYRGILKSACNASPKVDINSNPIHESRTWFKYISEKEISGSSKNIHTAIIKKVYTFGIDNDLILKSPIKKFQRFRSNPPSKESYTKDEIEAIWKCSQTHRERLYANFLRALFWTGCRPQELVDLTWEDVGDEQINIRSAKRNEKGAISRKCNIVPQLRECLDYAKSLYFGERVFLSQLGLPLHRSKIGVEVNRLCVKAGIKPKQLRHARSGLATEMLRAGYSIWDVKETLGHRNVTTTEKYLRESIEEKGKRFKGL